MESNYTDYIDEGTRRLMELLSSKEIEEAEQEAIITVFSNELKKNIGNACEMQDFDYLFNKVSIEFVDARLIELISSAQSEAEYQYVIKLCDRLNELTQIFEENGWMLPNLKMSNTKSVRVQFEKLLNSSSMVNWLLQADKDYDESIKNVKLNISVAGCEKSYEKLTVLRDAINQCKQNIVELPELLHKDVKKEEKLIDTLRREAIDIDNLFSRVSILDKHLYDLLDCDIEISVCNEIIDEAQELKSLLDEAKKKNWKYTELKIGNPEKIANQFMFYSSMLILDQEITKCRREYISDKHFQTLVEKCSKQFSNIMSCEKNGWPVPGLVNSNPHALIDSAEVDREKDKKRKKRNARARFILVGLAALFIFALWCINKSHEGKERIPFDDSYPKGQYYEDIFSELQKSGFENISLHQNIEGWQESGIVLGVTVDNLSSYQKNEYFEKDANIVITYSSNNRIDIKPLLSDWQKMDCQTVYSILKKAGFTNITEKEKETDIKDKDQLVYEIELNNINYINGSCFLPSDAPINLNYYILKICIGNTNSEFKDKDYLELVNELKSEGFTNIQTEQVTTGYQKGNAVVSVSVNNVTTYSDKDVFSPDTKIVVKYSSDDRVEATDSFSKWSESSYKNLEDNLIKTGFKNVITKPIVTTFKTQNLLVKSISINGTPYSGGKCYIPQTAKIVIDYYVLRITLNTDASGFEKCQYKEVVDTLSKRGFSNIILKRANDLTMGWFSDEGSVKSITFDGNNNFAANDSFEYDTEIVIVVHTFKKKGCDDITLIEE